MKSDHRSNDIRILSVGSCPAVCGLYLVLLFVPSDKEINSDYPEPEVDVNMDLEFYPNQEQDHLDIYDEPKSFISLTIEISSSPMIENFIVWTVLLHCGTLGISQELWIRTWSCYKFLFSSFQRLKSLDLLTKVKENKLTVSDSLGQMFRSPQ